MLVESAENSFCRGSVVMVTEMPGCDTVTFRTLTAWVHARDEMSVDINCIVSHKKAMPRNDRDIDISHSQDIWHFFYIFLSYLL